MSIKKLKAVAVAAGAIASVPASAMLVNVSQTVSLNQLLSGAGSSLSFDVSAFLSSQGLSAGNIVSGQLIVYGFSEQSYGQAAAGPYSGYVQTGSTGHLAYGTQYVPGYSYQYSYTYQTGGNCGWWGYSPCYATGYAWQYVPGYSYQFSYWISDQVATRYRDIQHVDNVADQLQVTAGGSSGVDTASTTSSVVNGYGASTYEGQVCQSVDAYGNCSYQQRYSRERDTYSAIYGDLQVSLGLDGMAVTDLKGDGVLDINMTMNAGQMLLQTVVLNLTIDQPQLDNNTPGTIPEPGTLLLGGAALAGMASATRRRKQRNEG